MVYNADVTRIKRLKMHIIYNVELQGFQIVYTPNNFIKKEIWNKPVNNRIYDSWGSACHDLDRWAE